MRPTVLHARCRQLDLGFVEINFRPCKIAYLPPSLSREDEQFDDAAIVVARRGAPYLNEFGFGQDALPG